MITQIEHIFSELRIALSLTDTEKIDSIIIRSLMDISKLLGAEKAYLYLPELKEEGYLNCSHRFIHKDQYSALPISIPIKNLSCILKKLDQDNVVSFESGDLFLENLSEYEKALVQANGRFTLLIRSSFQNDTPSLLIFGSTLSNLKIRNDEIDRFLPVSAQVFSNTAIHNRVLMDRNKLIQFEKLISEISSTFINISAYRIDEKITYALQSMALFFGLDRATIFLAKKNNKELVLTHLWAGSGNFLEIPREYVISEENWPWVTGFLRKGRIFFYNSNGDLPEAAAKDKQSWQFYGTKSACAIPLIADGKFLGVLSFDALKEEIKWPKEIIERASVLGKILAAALSRKDSEKRLRSSYEEIKALKERIQSENEYFKDEIKLQHNFEEIIGNSNELKYVLFKIEQIAATDATVVILGETGTGKELVARAIHEKSRRQKRPFVKIDCGSLPASIVERELFGHEKGTFTGADRMSKGRFEVADGGTLFLDEIGELPLELQPKLLRVIQDGEFERLGDTATRKLDIRIIAASNRDLEAEASLNKFRKDLWYRLNVFSITIPPLRDRKDDIPLLVNWFVKKFSRKMGKKIERIPTSVMKHLTMQEWPGNIRELQNTIERAVIISKGDTLRLVETMNDEIKPGKSHEVSGMTLSEVERNHFCRVLEETNWRIYGPKGAARILDLNPSTLRFRVKKLGIVKPGEIKS